LQKFPPQLTRITTLPCEILMLKTAIKLALIIQSMVNLTG